MVCEYGTQLASSSGSPVKYADILAGYRTLDQDYESGSGADRFKYGIRLSDPVHAVNFIW